MCLIILRQPNVTLDKVKFDTAVLNNPDGWGITVPDGKGILHTEKSIVTDKDELYAMLHDEFAADKIMLHLRYTTAGDTVIRNAHPFPILEYSSDGADLRMAHNGTLNKWAPASNAPNKWESDTRVFTRGFVRPLMKRLIRGANTEELLKDKFVANLLDTQLTTMSVLTFIDGYGNTMFVNEEGNGGFTDADGTYFSNKYSHDAEHRVVKPYQYRGANTTVGKTSGTTHTHVGGPQSTGRGTHGTSTSTTVRFTDCNAESFTDKHGITSEEDLFLLDDETIASLVDEEPEDAILLIQELLAGLYRATKATSSMVLKNTLKDKQIKDLNNKLKAKDKAHDRPAQLHAVK